MSDMPFSKTFTRRAGLGYSSEVKVRYFVKDEPKVVLERRLAAYYAQKNGEPLPQDLQGPYNQPSSEVTINRLRQLRGLRRKELESKRA